MVVHGGPEARFAPRYDPFIIRLVAEGIAVVAPNVRGSAGWGRRFVSLDDRRLRLNSVRDLTAVHASLARAGRRRDTGGGYRRVVRRLHDAGRARFLSGPLGGRHRDGRHQQPGHLPREHVAVPAPVPRGGVRIPRHRPRLSHRGLADDPRRSDSSTADADSRRQRSPGSGRRGAPAARFARSLGASRANS